MIMKRSDVADMLASQHRPVLHHQRQAERDELNRQVAAFLRGGGQIQQIETGRGAETPKRRPLANPDYDPARQARGGENGSAGNRTSGRLTASKAAKLVGVPEVELVAAIQAGTGPEPIIGLHTLLFTEASVKAWARDRQQRLDDRIGAAMTALRQREVETETE